MVDYVIETEASFNTVGDKIEYDIDLVQNLDDSGEIPVSTIATNKPENAQHIAFQGKSQEATVEFIIYEDGTDKSNGTYEISNIDDPRINGTEVNTIKEQIVWLTRYIQASSFGADWRMFGGRFDTPDQDDDPAVKPGTDVALTDLTVRETADNPLRAEATMQLKWGNII